MSDLSSSAPPFLARPIRILIRTLFPFLGPPIFFTNKLPSVRRKGVSQLRALPMPESQDYTQEYIAAMHALIDAEDAQSFETMAKNDMTAAYLQRVPNKPHLVQVSCPALVERRADILVGDSVLVRSAADSDVHCGYLYELHLPDKLYIAFDPAMLAALKESVPYIIQFAMPPTRWRCKHFALDFAQASQFLPLLLPPYTDTLCAAAARNDVASASNLVGFTFRDGNEEQQVAARRLLCRAPGTPPYLVVGPPQSGKTAILVNAAAQVRGGKGECPAAGGERPGQCLALPARHVLPVLSSIRFGSWSPLLPVASSNP